MSSRTDQLVLEVGQAKVTFVPGAPGCFDVHLEARTSENVAYLRIRPDADATEGFYGLGEWGDTVMHRGKLRPMPHKPEPREPLAKLMADVVRIVRGC